MEDDVAAKIIAEMKKSPRPLHIEINGEFLKTSLIEILDDDIMMDDDRKERKQEKFRQNVDDWNQYWRRKVRFSPEEKAQENYGYFAGWWYAYTGKKAMPAEVWQKAETRAVWFFKKYPHRTLVKASGWRDLCPVSEESPRAKGLTGVGELMQARMLHHLQGAFSEDVEMSQYYA